MYYNKNIIAEMIKKPKGANTGIKVTRVGVRQNFV
jgi:hypothetical protein